MTDPTPPDTSLSDIVDPTASATDRRAFLARASLLSLAIPGLTLVSCAPAGESRRDSTGAKQPALQDSGHQVHNSDSRLDSSVLKGQRAGPLPAQSNAVFQRFAPELPPLPAGNTLDLHWHTREAAIRISDDTVIAAWTFEGGVPGPIVHCRVGDTINFTLTNDVAIPHSMDFHAAQIDPKQAFRSIPRGESISYTFKPKYAGAFMYHCGTAPVLMHIGSGMFGAIIVSPREPLPPAREFVIVQNEFYLGDAVGGVRPSDYQQMLSTVPTYVSFNARPNQYIKEPIHVKQGDRVRFWVVNAGPTHACNFHVVGDQFDTVYLGAPPGSPIHGVQTWDVAPGGGMAFELACDVRGEFPFVNHGFGHGQKGSIGILVVD